MSVGRIVLFTLLVSYFVCDGGNASSDGVKRKTTSRMFTKLKVDGTELCQYINNDFYKLKGSWNFVLRTVTSRATPEIRCGHLEVTKILEYGFNSNLRYMTNEGVTVQVPMTGIFINETIAGLSELNDIMTGNQEWRGPYFVEMGICDNDTILFIEPIYYYGGSMVFTRDIPDNTNGLRTRFGTYGEQSGKEYTVRVPNNCAAE